MTRNPNRAPAFMMPVEFGAPFGEREEIAAEVDATVYARTTMNAVVSFLTNAEQLEAILPEGKGLRLRGDPVVSVSANYNVGDLRAWAGKTYEIVMVTFPVTFDGRNGQRHGEYSPIIWENMTDPILAGREALGWSKVYADIEPLRISGNKAHAVAGWYGYNFMDLVIDDLRRLSDEEIKSQQQAAAESPSEGSIHYKYIRKTGTVDEADADYLTMSTRTNAPAVDVRNLQVWRGDGSVAFHAGTWRQLPITIRSAVNALAELEVKGIVSAALTKTEAINNGGMGQTIILE